MRILVITLSSFFVLFICYLTIKMWGKSQTYIEYKHVILQSTDTPLKFIRPNFDHLSETIESPNNIYLDVTVTFDQKLVIPRRKWVSTEKPLRLFNYDEVKNDVILVADIKNHLQNKKIIFNLSENAQAIHETFVHDMKLIGLEKGENFIVTSAYEAPIKALKEMAPAFVYGTTQPEILKIISMQSMNLLEATTIRADVIIHPLKTHNHNFFSDEISEEIKRRHKKIIVGPINTYEIAEAQSLSPYAIIVNY